MHIEGCAAIVTGGASGLGAATARQLAAKGARVAIFDRNAELGVPLAAELAGVFVEVDITNEPSVVAGLDAAARRNGEARILVNCAGVGAAAKAVDREGLPLPLAKFRQVIEVNLNGTFNVLAKFAACAMSLDLLGEERGVIVNTASVAAFDGQIGQPAYAASKAGIVGMTLPLAREFARAAIRVVTIAPGIFHTPLLAGLSDEVIASLGQQVPFPSRLGRPEEFAALVESIVTNAMLNGETIRLDGAIRMAPR